jgi:hypothetical protein
MRGKQVLAREGPPDQLLQLACLDDFHTEPPSAVSRGLQALSLLEQIAFPITPVQPLP